MYVKYIPKNKMIFFTNVIIRLYPEKVRKWSEYILGEKHINFF